MVCQPVPRHASQRPPTELNEKSRAVIPREVARDDFAKSWRIARHVVVGFQAFKARRAGKRKIQFIVVEHMKHENIVAQLSQ